MTKCIDEQHKTTGKIGVHRAWIEDMQGPIVLHKIGIASRIGDEFCSLVEEVIVANTTYDDKDKSLKCQSQSF